MNELDQKWYQRRVFSVRIGEALLLVGIYLLFAFLYALTLWLNRMGPEDPDDHLFEFGSLMNNGGLQYLIELVLTVVVWILVFRIMRQRPLWQRLLAHLVTMPLWVYGAQQIYYVSCEALGMFHLKGAGSWWDIYIPMLFYILQFGILHAYEYFTSYQKKLRNEIELKNAALRSELSAIKAQLNPHFLYNVFNTISASVPPELETTREMIARLSDLFRYQLRASQTDLVPLRDELEFVRGYLELEQQRFEDRLTVDIHVPDHLLEAMVPPMILQPIVENSVKHGLASLIEGGKIKVRIEQEDGKLTFEVADTGVGVEDKEEALRSGVGLSNTQMRLQKMYDSSLQLLDNSPRGLIVRFAL